MSKIELTPEQMAQGFTIDENVFGDLCLFDKNNNAWRLEFRSMLMKEITHIKYDKKLSIL